MAGRYTDAERLARGQYKVNGQWYTSSGYKIRNANDGTGSLSGSYPVYEDAVGRESEKAAAKSSTKSTTADTAEIKLLQSQKQQAALDTEKALRQAYISHVKALRDIEQQLSASGYSGGMADSAYLALDADYENRRGDILAAGEKTAADYDAKILAKRAAAAESSDTAAESTGTARTGIGTAAKTTGTAKTGTAKTTAAKTSTAKTTASKTGSTKTQVASNAKSSGASYSDLQKAYTNAKSQEVTSAMLAGRLTQGQARVQKNLLKKMLGK